MAELEEAVKAIIISENELDRIRDEVRTLVRSELMQAAIGLSADAATQAQARENCAAMDQVVARALDEFSARIRKAP